MDVCGTQNLQGVYVLIGPGFFQVYPVKEASAGGGLEVFESHQPSKSCMICLVCSYPQLSKPTHFRGKNNQTVPVRQLSCFFFAFKSPATGDGSLVPRFLVLRFASPQAVAEALKRAGISEQRLSCRLLWGCGLFCVAVCGLLLLWFVCGLWVVGCFRCFLGVVYFRMKQFRLWLEVFEGWLNFV